MAIFKLVFSFVGLLLFSYCYHQLTRWAEFSTLNMILIFAFLFIMFAAVVSVPILFWSQDRNNLSKNHRNFIKFSYLCLGFINFLLVFILIRDIFSFTVSFLNWNIIAWYSSQWCLSLLLLPLPLTLMGYLKIRRGSILKTIQVHSEKIKNNYKILQISDLHISDHLIDGHVQQLVKLINEQNCDLICMTGDIFDDLPSEHQSEINLLKTLKPKYGVYYVTGNHEYYWDIKNMNSTIADLGWKNLVNTADVVTPDLQILGVPDLAAKMFHEVQPSVEKIAQLARPELFNLLLCHQPKLADLFKDKNIDLQLSGHTHRGQFFPWNLLIGLFQKYAYGLYQIEQMKLYVNQGTGYWGVPMRLGTYCEVTEILLIPK